MTTRLARKAVQQSGWFRPVEGREACVRRLQSADATVDAGWGIEDHPIEEAGLDYDLITSTPSPVDSPVPEGR